MLKWIVRNNYAKFDRNIPCGLRFMSIYTNWPLPAWLMLDRTLSARRKFYACQCLDNVKMYTYAKLIKLVYHLVLKLWAFNNDRITAKEWTAAKTTGCLNSLWRQIFALDSAGFLLKHKCVKLVKRIYHVCKTLPQRNKLSMIWWIKENGSQRVKTKVHLKLSHGGPSWKQA